jgi:hypothetical protein
MQDNIASSMLHHPSLKRKADFDRETIKRLKPFTCQSPKSYDARSFVPELGTFHQQQEEEVLTLVQDRRKTANVPLQNGEPLLPSIALLLPEAVPYRDVPTVTPKKEETISFEMQQIILNEIESMKRVLDSNNGEIRLIKNQTNNTIAHIGQHLNRRKTMQILRDPQRFSPAPPTMYTQYR